MLTVDVDIGNGSLAGGLDDLEGEELGVLHVDDFAFEFVLCEEVLRFDAPVAGGHGEHDASVLCDERLERGRSVSGFFLSPAEHDLKVFSYRTTNTYVI